MRSIAVEAEDGEAARLFHGSVAAVAGAWFAGAMFPRVEDPKGSARHCEFCPVAEACLRTDSGYRRRIKDWAAAVDSTTLIEAAGRRLWWLGEERPGGGS